MLIALQSGGLCREDWMTDQQTFDPFTAIRPGSYFSHYLIEAEVGSGTFARVYRARDLQLDRPVALKVFKPDCPVTPSAALAEARCGCCARTTRTSARSTPWTTPRACPSSRWSISRDSRSASSRGASSYRSSQLLRSPARSLREWRPPTRPASCTATSSPRT